MALVLLVTPLIRTWPVVGRKRVSTLAVPLRKYSCGWPNGRCFGYRRVQDVALFCTARLHLRTKPANPRLRPTDRHVRLVFFSVCVGVDNRYHAFFMLSFYLPGLTPRSIGLPTIACFMQHPTNRFSAYFRQPITRLP